MVNDDGMTFQERREHIAPYKDIIYGFDDGGITYLPHGIVGPSILVQAHPELIEQIVAVCQEWYETHKGA